MDRQRRGLGGSIELDVYSLLYLCFVFFMIQ